MNAQPVTPGTVRDRAWRLAVSLQCRPVLRGDMLIQPPDFRQVGECSWEVARQMAANFPMDPDARTWPELAEIVGWLLHAIDHFGCSHDDVVSACGSTIAAVLEVVSEDLRLSGPRRRQSLCSRIAQPEVTPVAQIVILAETEVYLRDVPELFTENALAWISNRQEVLDYCRILRNTPATTERLNRVLGRLSLLRRNRKPGATGCRLPLRDRKLQPA